MHMEQAKILYVRKKKVKRNNIINNAKIMQKCLTLIILQNKT